MFEAGIAARVHVTFDERHADLVHDEEWEAFFVPLRERLDQTDRHDVDHDERDFVTEAPPGATYLIPKAKIDGAGFFRTAASEIKKYLYRDHSLTLLRNEELDLVARVGEDDASFAQRCDAAAQDRADEEAAALRDKYETRMKRLRSDFDKAERRAAELEADLQGARQDQLLDSAGAIFDMLRGRRRTRSITGSARSRASRRSKEQRLETAHGKVQDAWQAMSDLEQDLLDELEEINDRWESAAEQVETLEVGLEKDDIQVDELMLVWVPVGR